MKKAISLLLALVMCLSLCACGGGNDTPETSEATAPPADAIKIDMDAFFKECSSNIAKVSNDYEGKTCIIEGFISEIEKDHIALYYGP